MKKGFTAIFILVGILVIMAIAAGAYYFGKLPIKPTNNTPPIVCSTIAKVCPDGSIADAGPNCEFAPCPSPKTDETAGWETYSGEIFLIKYPNNFIVAPTELAEVIESIQFGERGKEQTNFIRVSAALGGETLYNNRKSVYIGHILNLRQEDIVIDGIKGVRFSTTDNDGTNFRQYTLFFKNNLEFEIDNFGIDKKLFTQILSTFKFLQ